jgi:GMP synthase-like glutamine amidotransferase
MSQILIINLNNKTNLLHELEYIKPITQIIQKENKKIEIINYIDVTKKIIEKSSHIILSGTGLLEFEYLNHLDKFDWIKKSNKNIIGICAGCQIIQKIFNSEETKIQEIGLLKPEILIQDKIIKNESLKEIYTLHSTNFKTPKEFQIIAQTKIPQIIKHNNIYGILFHPEVRNHQIIKNFINFE